MVAILGCGQYGDKLSPATNQLLVKQPIVTSAGKYISEVMVPRVVDLQDAHNAKVS